MQGRLHIRKSGSQYFVDHFGSNGRILNNSERFTQKPSAWTNVKSTVKDFGKTAVVLVQDDSLQDGAIVYKVFGTGKVTKTDLKARKVKVTSSPRAMRENLSRGVKKAINKRKNSRKPVSKKKATKQKSKRRR